MQDILSLGAIFILRKDIGVGGPENGNFPLLYVGKMSLRSTLARTDLLYMLNWGTQWIMVSYLKNK